MALTDALRELDRDQEASAAVEFIVLIPVYMLLIAGLFMTVNLLMARQSLVQAARFQVWSATKPNTFTNFTNGKAFFTVDGTFTPGTRTEKPVTVWGGSVKNSDLGSGGGKELDLAADVLNNWTGGANDHTLYQVTANPSFTYSGLVIFGLGTIPQSTQCGVLLPRNKPRTEYDSAKKDGHPVLAWRANGTAGKSAYYDPSKEANMPLNPLFDGGYGEFQVRGDSANSGVWDKKARIGGDAGSEWAYYEDKPKKN